MGADRGGVAVPRHVHPADGETESDRRPHASARPPDRHPTPPTPFTGLEETGGSWRAPPNFSEGPGSPPGTGRFTGDKAVMETGGAVGSRLPSLPTKNSSGNNHLFPTSDAISQHGVNTGQSAEPGNLGNATRLRRMRTRSAIAGPVEHSGGCGHAQWVLEHRASVFMALSNLPVLLIWLVREPFHIAAGRQHTNTEVSRTFCTLFFIFYF